jgi:predicted transcriptional regulator
MTNTTATTIRLTPDTLRRIDALGVELAKANHQPRPYSRQAILAMLVGEALTAREDDTSAADVAAERARHAEAAAA